MVPSHRGRPAATTRGPRRNRAWPGTEGTEAAGLSPAAPATHDPHQELTALPPGVRRSVRPGSGQTRIRGGVSAMILGSVFTANR